MIPPPEKSKAVVLLKMLLLMERIVAPLPDAVSAALLFAMVVRSMFAVLFEVTDTALPPFPEIIDSVTFA